MRKLLNHRFKRTTLQGFGYVAVLGGLGLAHSGFSVSLGWCLLLGLLAIGFSTKRTVVSLVLVITCALAFGCFRGAIYYRYLQDYEPYYGQKITLLVQANNDATYGKTSQLSFDAGNLRLNNGEQLNGKIQVSGFGVNAVYQGDVLAVSGKLYPGYGAYQGRISFGVLDLVEHHPTMIASVRRTFAASVQTALPEPLAPFAMGLLVGQRATLPDTVKQDLLMVGLTHIIAVSGYNLTIMLGASKRILGKRSKRITTFLALVLMGLFLLMAGASASIVRAAIVSMLSIGAAYYGRTFKPLNVILLAALVTAWASPYYLWSDISWYLSFLAFYGVMVVGPLLSSKLKPSWQEAAIPAVAIESISAEIMTVPFVLHNFGQMSFIGLVANVLVVTLVPLAMLLGLIAGLAGMFLGSFAGWFAWPARLLLNYMLDVAHILAKVPGIFVQNLALSMTQMLMLYAVTFGISIALLYKTNRQDYATITDRNTDKTEEKPP